MVDTVRFLITISRPRFWLYLFGTYIVGLSSAVTSPVQYQQSWIILLGIYFLFPANLYLYGINDVFDQDTDHFNPKKGGKESKFSPSKHNRILIPYLIFHTIITLVLIVFIPNLLIKTLLLIFFLLSTIYSAPPFRFKKYPFVDFSSNILYAIPGFIGYSMITQQMVPPMVLLATYCWTSAMHLFSAIPDIEADSKAKLKTTAVFLGKNASLVLCGLSWIFFALIPLFNQFAFPINIVFFIYPTIILLLLIFPFSVKKIYWYFPWINGGIGFLLFWYFTFINILV